VIGLGRDQNPKIEFIADTKAYSVIFDKPEPAKNFIPEWYKKTRSNFPGDFMERLDKQSGNPGRTVKACMPVFDMITAGYIITIPAEVYVNPNSGPAPETMWSVDNFSAIESHSNEQFKEMKLDSSFYETAIKFSNPWIIKTPPGYSCMFIQPSMRDDLPFQIVPAIVDTDKHPVPINFPTFFKKDFEGIIPLGTPIVQIIPFKRESWSSEYSYNETKEDSSAEFQMAKRKFQNRYKTFFRAKKEWN
jgi:hypothetical protein